MSEAIAREVFARTRYQASDEDIQRLSENIILLGSRGLDSLNKRLVDGGRKVWDTIAEHNFAAQLALSQSFSVPIQYEPPEMTTTPDFKIEKEGITYWIQMKKLAESERENRQKKIIEQIERMAKGIEVKKFFGCDLSSTFTEKDIDELMNFIKNTEKDSIEDHEYFFQNDVNKKAKITFWYPKILSLSHLTLGTSGDMDTVEVTGISAGQIKNSLCKASNAFRWEAKQDVINLIVMEADNHHDTNICEATFGTEYEIWRENRHTWSRKNDGFFQGDQFSKKVSGVIAIKRIEKYKPICSYYMDLYINDVFKYHIDNINRLFSFTNIVHYNMRPPMGYSNFNNS